MERSPQDKSTTRLNTFLDSYGAVVLVLLLFTASRLVLLTRLPIFLDEALYIMRARDAVPNDIFIGIRGNKLLYPLLLGLLHPDGPEALWLARSLNGLASVITCAGCIALGRLFDSPRTGLLAGVVYMVLPFSVFHTRQALVDPFMSVFAMLTLVFAVWLTRKPTVPIAVLTGVALGTTYLTKALALPYFVVPLAAVAVLMPWGRRQWRAGVLALLSTGIGAGIVFGVFEAARSIGRGPHTKAAVNSGKLSAYFDASLPEIINLLGAEFAQYWEVLWVYMGLPLIALVVLSLFLIVRGEQRRTLLFMWLPAVAFAAPPVLARRPQGFLPARYLTHTSAPFVVLGVLAAVGLLRVLSQWLPQQRRDRATWLSLATGVVLLLLVVVPLPQDFGIVLNPADARLHSRDRWQYVTSVVGGYGRSDAAEFLIRAWEANDYEQIAVIASSSPAQISAQVGPRAAIFREWERYQRSPTELPIWLALGRPVYFVDEIPDNPMPESPYGAITELVATYPLVNGTLRIYRVEGADDALRGEIHRNQFIQPDDARMEGVYPALVDRLSADPTPRVVAVYPPDQLATLEALLADAPQVTLQAIGDQWPFDPDETASELEALAAGQDFLQVVFLQETLGDPDRTIEDWLTCHLFVSTETWIGPLRLVGYDVVSGLELTPVEATFGEDISLQQAAVVEPDVSAGRGVRVALSWHADETPDGMHNVFAHLMDEEGTLVAQHDGIPRGGLSPTDSWDPARTPIPDRFVIALPGDVTPGTYELRIGLYDPISGVRLPLTSDSAGGPDYVTLGEVEVR